MGISHIGNSSQLHNTNFSMEGYISLKSVKFNLVKRYKEIIKNRIFVKFYKTHLGLKKFLKNFVYLHRKVLEFGTVNESI